MNTSDGPSLEQVRSFLQERFGSDVHSVEPLRGGFWSSAYRFDLDEEALVLRLSKSSEGFEMDRAAHRFDRPGLPIPKVLEIGVVADRSFAISRRAAGRFLEDLEANEAEQAAPMIDSLLAGFRSVNGSERSSLDWFGDTGVGSWRGWLSERLVDDPDTTVSGWRRTLADDSELDDLFRRTEDRITQLLPHCPERRDLLHGDLLHQNVLFSQENYEITAVFSWKCSTRGDHIYDVAWLSFWEPWHPGIARVDAWGRLFREPIEGDDLADAALRHHCYELNIGAQHLAWCAWTNEAAELAAVARRTEEVLTRGPRET